MEANRHEQLMFGAAALAAALATVLVGRDLALKAEGSEATGAIRLLQLFTYNYKRPWPDTLDFSAMLGGFTVVAGLLGIALSVRSLRRHAVAAVCAFGILWAVWGLDVYMTALSPHWGQHEVIEAYYRDRKSPEEALVAYQMNWKGENFYTGNHIPAFVSSRRHVPDLAQDEREKGTKVMYFVTEHSRYERPAERSRAARATKRSPTRLCATSSFSFAPSSDPTPAPGAACALLSDRRARHASRAVRQRGAATAGVQRRSSFFLGFVFGFGFCVL